MTSIHDQPYTEKVWSKNEAQPARLIVYANKLFQTPTHRWLYKNPFSLEVYFYFFLLSETELLMNDDLCTATLQAIGAFDYAAANKLATKLLRVSMNGLRHLSSLTSCFDCLGIPAFREHYDQTYQLRKSLHAIVLYEAEMVYAQR